MTEKNESEKMHKVEFIKDYRYADENNVWQSRYPGDKVDLADRFYANFKKLGLIKDAK